ncbi:MAG: TylF/MycF/NovP-related O-methyltransferase [Burkholderiales bacterium]
MSSLRWNAPGADGVSTNFPIEDLRALKRRHEQAPLDLHTRILFEHASIAGADLLQLYESCMRESSTVVSPWKTLARIQGAANLARYFLHTLELDGARAECGVFQGFSALFACRAAALRASRFDGTGFHLVDSFAGFPQPRAEDFIPIRSGNDTRNAPAFSAGDAAVSFEQVQAVFRDFPGVRFHRGFIPQVLAQLPDTRWAFVHVDVDLHEPTLASLEYFYPRMVKGGVILCDDYGSRLFPGARKAWESYCENKSIAFVTLDTGQSVIIK